MMRRAVLFLMVSLMVAVGLTGCGSNPDKLFKDGKYTEAYTEFVKRAGTNEIKLKTETVNASAYETQQRQKSGNQALHDYYFAAECQKQLGNTSEANMYYQKTIDISKYQIRTPHDQGALLKASFASLLSAVQSYRSAQVDYIDEATRPPEEEDTDPYDSGSDNTDPYSGGSGNTDPYSGGSSDTDPYSGGSSTDPYNSVAKSETVAKSASVSDTWMRSAYNTMVSRRQEFEKLLYSTTADQVSNIQSVKDQYRTFSSALDSYLSFASPSKTVSNPEWVESFASMYYRSVSSAGNQFTSTLSGAQSKITYTVENLNVAEPQLVVQATAALGDSASSSSQAQSAVEPEQTTAFQVEGSVAPATGDIKTAEASLKAAFNTYKNLCTIGADEAEVKKALSAYNEAKDTFNALKKQQ